MSKTITLITSPEASTWRMEAIRPVLCEICGQTFKAAGLKRHLTACRSRQATGTRPKQPSRPRRKQAVAVASVPRAVAPVSQPVAPVSQPSRTHPSIPAANAAAVAEIYGELYGEQTQFWATPTSRSCRLMEFGSFMHPENTSRVIPAQAQRERAADQLERYRTRER